MARRHRTKDRKISTAPHGAAAASVHQPALPTDHFRHALLGAAAALLVARPLVPSDGGAWTGDGQVAAALWIALAVLWGVQSLGRPRLRVRFGWIDATMVAFVGWWSVAALMGSAHAAPRPSINMLWEGVAILLTFLLFRQLVEPEGSGTSGGGREARALVAVMIAVGIVLAITAIYQYFVSMPAMRERFVEHPASMFREAQIAVAAPGTQEFRRFADRLNSPEPLATFDLTNSLAAYLAPWLVIALGIATLGWGFSQSRLRARRNWLAVGACALPIALALALTHSRSAWIGAGVGFACLVIWRLSADSHKAAAPNPGKADKASSTGKDIHPPSLGLSKKGTWRLGRCGQILTIVALIVAILGGAAIAARPQLLDPAIRSFQVRLDYWRATRAMIADRPWWGCGPGNFGDYYTQYKLPAGTEEIQDPHNFALEIAASAGLPALILFLTVLAGFAYRLWRRGGIADVAADQASGGAAAETADAPRSADGTWWILGGAMLGLWLAFGWNQYIARFPASEEETIVRMFAAGVTWWLLWSWIRRGTLPPRLCGIGVLVLLVALLAVGGITFGGVNETLWLLLALGLNATEFKSFPLPTDATGQEADSRKSLPWIGSVLLLAAVAALWLEQHQTGYKPTLGCEGALEAARGYAADGDHEKQEQQLLNAAAADPYAVEPRWRLARLRLEQWLHGDKLGIGDFEKWMNQALQLEPQSASLLDRAGTDWRQVFEVTKIPADGRKAVEFYRRAVELYPTGVVVHLELADALSATGDSAVARDAAREALRLDALRSEAERALNDEQRKLAERIILGEEKVSGTFSRRLRVVL